MPSLVPPVTVTAAGAGGCDYRSTDPKTCCVCESSTMCLAESGFYRTCDAVTGADGKSGNCYSVEKKCTTAVCQSDDSINNPLQPCPDAKASDFKCASAGSISSLSQQDGATYLDICDKSFKEINAQCTLSTKQKYAAVCYEASKNGLPAALALIDRQGYGFTIKDNDPGVKVAKGLFIVNQDGITACQDIAATELSLSDLENQIKSNLGDSWDTVRLACCLTDDHCKARGCDEKIVYDSVHGCGLETGPNNPYSKANQLGLGACDICTKDTFGCGNGISSAGNYEACAQSKDDPGINCWSADKVCVAKTSDAQDAAQDYCATFGCYGAPGPQTWTAAKAKEMMALQNKPKVKNTSDNTDCVVCDPDKATYACGGDLTEAQDGYYNYRTCRSNKGSIFPESSPGCWGENLACAVNDTTSGCSLFCKKPASGSLSLTEWSEQDAVKAKAAQKGVRATGAIACKNNCSTEGAWRCVVKANEYVPRVMERCVNNDGGCLTWATDPNDISNYTDCSWGGHNNHFFCSDKDLNDGKPILPQCMFMPLMSDVNPNVSFSGANNLNCSNVCVLGNRNCKLNSIVYQECRIDPLDKCPTWYMDSCDASKPAGSDCQCGSGIKKCPDPQCTLGAVSCREGQRSYGVCEHNSDTGCFEPVSHMCQDNETTNSICACEPPPAKPTCVDRCTVGARTCAVGGQNFNECRKNNTSGCTEWVSDVCGGNAITGSDNCGCVNPPAKSTCVSYCDIAKDKRTCTVGSKNFKDCVKNSNDDCYNWVSGSCQGDTVTASNCDCVGTPVRGCVDQCTVGARTCAVGGQNFNECRKNSSGCAVWVSDACQGNTITGSNNCGCVNKPNPAATTCPNPPKCTIGNKSCVIGESSYSECRYVNNCPQMVPADCPDGQSAGMDNCACKSGCLNINVIGLDPCTGNPLVYGSSSGASESAEWKVAEKGTDGNTTVRPFNSKEEAQNYYDQTVNAGTPSGLITPLNVALLHNSDVVETTGDAKNMDQPVTPAPLRGQTGTPYSPGSGTQNNAPGFGSNTASQTHWYTGPLNFITTLGGLIK